MADPRDTPAMRQYYAFKRQFPDCVLLFRMGDFYECFDDDAVKLSKALGLTLTQRTAGVPMAGVPHHQRDNYLRRALAAGFRVAIADQVQDPKDAKGVVARAVTQVVTPGTLTDESLLGDGESAPLAAVVFTGSGDDSAAALAVVDLNDGDFRLFDGSAADVRDELARRGVRELLYADAGTGEAPVRVKRMLDALGISGTARPAWHFRRDEAVEALREHFGVATLAGFGLSEEDAAAPAAGVVLRYLRETQVASIDPKDCPPGVVLPTATLGHLRPPRRERVSRYCGIDAVSMRALEIERTIRTGALEGSLLGVFLCGKGVCRTPMGKRLVREWLKQPLADAAALRMRQEAVALLVEDTVLADAIAQALEPVQDAARIAGRLALGRATPRDVVGLGASLACAPGLLEAMRGAPALGGLRSRLESAAPVIAPIAQEIGASCVESPPQHLRDGGLFKDGVDAELDECRVLERDSTTWLTQYQAQLVAEFDLPSLKVGYNQVFGYFIELPAAQARRAPERLTRKQTLKNAERYITPELKEFEEKVSTARARALEREQKLFRALCEKCCGAMGAIGAFADAVAEIDATLGLAQKARQRGWKRPEIVEEPVLVVHGGRHPVLDESLAGRFVPNDAELGTWGGAERARLALITGPNMAGKSTYIRQNALIAVLALAGSFVPADRAVVGIADRIFTRVGADDALHQGQSTFMVEMTETANILNHATERSLVILDEIGRGTSTLDGLSLAWAIAEHLAGVGGVGARTLFATHYHELTQLEETLPGKVGNLHVVVRELGEEIIFLHRIAPGGTDRSYGIHVARLAGLPRGVVERARQILGNLAVEHSALGNGKKVKAPAGQLGLFTEYVDHPAVTALREVKIEGISPLQAFEELRRLREMAEDGALRGR